MWPLNMWRFKNVNAVVFSLHCNLQLECAGFTWPCSCVADPALLFSQVPTECERSPSLWRHVQERTSSWDATCPTPWTASPTWWSGSSMECPSPFSSTFASTLLMWTRNTPVRWWKLSFLELNTVCPLCMKMWCLPNISDITAMHTPLPCGTHVLYITAGGREVKPLVVPLIRCFSW